MRTNNMELSICQQSNSSKNLQLKRVTLHIIRCRYHPTRSKSERFYRRNQYIPWTVLRLEAVTRRLFRQGKGTSIRISGINTTAIGQFYHDSKLECLNGQVLPFHHYSQCLFILRSVVLPSIILFSLITLLLTNIALVLINLSYQ